MYGIYSAQVLLDQVPEEAEQKLRESSSDFSLTISEKIVSQAWIAVNALLLGFTKENNLHFFVKLLADRNCNNMQFLNTIQVCNPGFLRYMVAGILLD